LRVWRFIKLIPEQWIFQDPAITTSNNANLTTNAKPWVVGHYTPTWTKNSPFLVCLIELFAWALDSFKDTSSNTLILFLFNVTLLDMDITNSTTEYPAAHLPAWSAYWLNSWPTISMWNRIIWDSVTLTTSRTSAPSTPYYPTRWSNDYSFFEKHISLNVLHHNIVVSTAAEYTIAAEWWGPVIRKSHSTFIPQRTTYHLFLWSIVFIANVSWTSIVWTW